MTEPLSDLKRDILEFEKLIWKHAGAKEAAVRDRWAISMTRYYQLLNALIDKPAAAEADPVLVHRLTRLRDRRGAARRRTDGPTS